MSASTVTAGHPVHRVETFRRWTNQHGCAFTDWTAPCGAARTESGHHGALRQAGAARRLELCPTCFPGRQHGGYFPEPRELAP